MAIATVSNHVFYLYIHLIIISLYIHWIFINQVSGFHVHMSFFPIYLAFSIIVLNSLQCILPLSLDLDTRISLYLPMLQNMAK